MYMNVELLNYCCHLQLTWATAMFRKVGSDIVVLRSLSPLPRPYLLIADATALKV
jgi:hypothetical protein